MGWGMQRRLATTLAAVAALGAALPASAGASTLFTLSGHGWGHGIGMSQYGALGYALHGYSYGQILPHYFTGTRIAPVSQGVTERVLMESGVTVVDVSAAAPITILDEGTNQRTAIPAGAYRVRFGTTAGRLQVVDRSTGADVATGLIGPVAVLPSSAPLELDDASGMGYTNDHWDGWFRVLASGSRLDCVNVVSMERYLRGVVPSEVPASWPIAALRAQAVASRSYAYATRSSTRAFDAYSDTRSQAYGPIERHAAATTAAVDDTHHQVVWYGSTIATTFFSSSSGGRTSSEQASWGSTSGEPYLVPVSDPYDSALGQNPNHTWTPKAYTVTGLANAFGYTSPVASVDETIDKPSQRVLTLVLHTPAADRSLTGPAVQSRLGLRSTYFRVLQTSLSTDAHSITVGTAIHLSGRVWPRPNTKVTLLRRKGTSTTWEVGQDQVPIASDGRFALRLVPSSDRHYRLVVRGDPRVSPVIYVRVSAAAASAKAEQLVGRHVP
jgi:stage II sporulation protein D